MKEIIIAKVFGKIHVLEARVNGNSILPGLGKWESIANNRRIREIYVQNSTVAYIEGRGNSENGQYSELFAPKPKEDLKVVWLNDLGPEGGALISIVIDLQRRLEKTEIELEQIQRAIK